MSAPGPQRRRLTGTTGGRRCVGCGTLLAADNTARLCSKCHREQRDQLRMPPAQLKNEFFETDEFRASFESQHIGKVFKAYRNHPRHLHLFGKALNQELLGRWLGLTQAQVSKLENGKPEQNLEALRNYARILGLPRHMLWFDFAGQSRLGSPLLSEPALEAWELVDLMTQSHVSMETLDHMERAVLGYAAQYPATPPDALLASVSRQIASIKETLGQPQRLQAQQRCVVLLGVLSGLAGNLWFDLGREDQATAFFDVGELTGREANDPDLTSWLLATRSIVPFFARRYDEATELLARSEEAAAIRSTTRRRAWIAALRARAAAANGDRNQCLAALERATQHIGNVTDPPTGTDFFDAPRLEGIAGSAHMLMADTERAAPLLSRALDRRSVEDAKGRALLTLDLAECHVIAREPEEASRLANTALDAAHGTLVNPVMTRVYAMRAGLSQWANVRAVRELDARVVGLISEQ